MPRFYGLRGAFSVVLAVASWLCAHASLAQSAPARYVVMQLQQGFSDALRAELASHGYREVRVLSGQRLLLERVASAADSGKSLYGLPLRPFERSERISSELLSLPAESRSANAAVPVMIHTMPGSGAERVLHWLEAAGLPKIGAGAAGESLRISTRVPVERLNELIEHADLEDVLFIERIHHLGLFNDRSAGTVQSGTQGVAEAATPIWAKGIRGEGQVVGLIDTGVDADGCWYSGASEKLPKTNTWSEAGGYGKEVDDSHSKVIAYDFLYSCDQFKGATDCDDPAEARAWDSNGHGTHCSGSMVGHRESGGNNGMAPAAKLVAQDAGYKVNDCADLPGIGCPVVDLYPLFEQAYAQGVRVHNNSYGDNENAPTPQPSNYSARSQDVDRFMWDHKDMLLVFAAGNSGMGNAEFSVASPSTAKNSLSVGSARTMPTANSDDDLSSFSSRGWTADGRIKPDLIAPGCNTSAGNDRNNASHNCTENSGCGTSYAAPVVVGAAALVRQYLMDGFYPSGAKNAADALQPTAAVVKALLVNSAVSMKGRDNAGGAITPIPSNEQGWGRIQLDRSLVFAGAARTLFLDDHKEGFAAGSSSTLEYTVSGLDAGEPLKVTLTWTDYPGTPDGAPRAPKLDDPASFNASQLVNNLDLEVTDGTTTYLGNVFADGTSMTGGMADTRNNVEQVLISKPTTGNWTVRVKAASITKETQDFALVMTGKWASAAPAGAPATGAAGTGAPAMQPSAAGSNAPVTGAAGIDAAAASSGVAGSAATPASGAAPAAGRPSAAGTWATTNAAAAGSGASSSTNTLPQTAQSNQASEGQGSGGCSAGTTSGATYNGLLPLLAAALGLVARRRRRGSARS